MVNRNHLRVLIRKDGLTLKRNIIFFLSFVILPVIMIAGFSFLQSRIASEYTPLQHNFKHTTYTKKNKLWDSFMNSTMKYQPPNWEKGIFNASMMFGCGSSSRRDVGFIAPKKTQNNYIQYLINEFHTKGIQLYAFDTVDEFYDVVRNNTKKDWCFGFAISEVNSKSKEVNVTYMFPRDVSPDTHKPLYDLSTINPDWRGWNTTFWFGTPQFMIYVTDLILMLMTGRPTAEIELAFLPMKTPEINTMDKMASGNLIMIFPIFIMGIYLLPLYYMVTKLAEERESRAREGMKMMGLKDSTYFLAWAIFLSSLVGVMSLLVCVTGKAVVFAKTDIILPFLMCFLYGLTLYGLAFGIVSIFPSKKGSATVASLVHLMSYYFAVAYGGHNASYPIKLIVSLVPNACLTFLIEHMLNCEYQGSGLTGEFIFMEIQNYNFASGLIMLVVDIILIGCVGLYLDQVVSKDIGVAKPWNFLCKKKDIGLMADGSKLKLGPEKQDPKKVKSGNFESIQSTLLKDSDAFKVRNLRKVFKNGTVAVDDLSLTMYEGQIFALLGHNGAGKTTTISMLTGLLNPSGGQAELNGLDVFKDQDTLRQNLGVCPQHNVLFDYLTVREHLELYAAFKGVAEDKIRSKIDKMIYEVELVANQHQLANTLSGGQKRKLSVAIALIGDSKVVMLDEPTSGMDTTTRRRFWEMLKQYKEGRIVILTTHYMDEADILGDRICIMAEGNVQCCGSSLFLKNRYGVGYNLVLAKTPDANPDKVDHFLKSRLPEATKLQEVSTEITYQIPDKCAPKFKEFFSQLDLQKMKMGIGSYGIGITTMEEVFLSIGHGEDQVGRSVNQIKHQMADQSKMTPREQILTQYSIANDHRRNFVTQFMALARKKALVLIRDPKAFFMDFFFPLILIFSGLWLSTQKLVSDDLPRRSVTVYDFPQERPLMINRYNFNQTDDEVTRFVKRSMLDDVGPGKLWNEVDWIEHDIRQMFFDQCAYVDDLIFEHAWETGQPQYGQYFVQQASRDDLYYSIGTFSNTSCPIATTAYAGYALQSVVRDVTGNDKFRLNFFEKPLPLGYRLQTYVNSAQGMIAVMAIAIAYMLASDQIAHSIIKEKNSNVKHQIFISGASRIAYWGSHLLVDIVYHLVLGSVAQLAIKVCNIDAVDFDQILLLFAIVNPCFVYSMTFFFETDSKASVLIRIMFFVLGGVAPIAIQILRVVNPRTNQIGEMLKPYFVPWPIYNLTMSYISIINRQMLTLYHESNTPLEPLDFKIAGESYEYLQVCFLYCFSFLILCEIGVYNSLIRPLLHPLYLQAAFAFKKLHRKKEYRAYSIKRDFDALELWDSGDEEETISKILNLKDPDPKNEEKRVKQSDPQKNSLTISQLSKSYEIGSLAVQNLSFGLEYGECFALLGVTGAGKTTTFKCLTGEEYADEGNLFMGGQDVRTRSGFNKARCLIGYCPQFDTLLENLTVRHHLEIYAAIKGVRSDYRQELIEKQIAEMDLYNYEHVNAGQLSGGNKRKLMCAIALIGNPPIVLLDEPSTGVDPQAKRFMWTIISNISTLRKQSTVVLTTHSMEEAEALCTKMGIMVDGRFKCFGSSTHIKDKYGNAFEIEIKTKVPSDQEVEKEKIKRNVQMHEFVSPRGLRQMLTKLDALELSDEFSATGCGKELQKVLQKQGKLALDELIRWCFIQKASKKLVAILQAKFSEVELQEHFGNSFTFKVSRDGHSIGSVFGLMEDVKDICSLTSYAAQQTSLEQIFNMFARTAGAHRNKTDRSKKDD